MFILNQHDLYIKCYVGRDLFTSLFFKNYILYNKKKSYFIYFDNPFYNSHNVHYTKGRGTLAEGEHLWLVPTARPSWGRVRYALGMDTQN